MTKCILFKIKDLQSKDVKDNAYRITSHGKIINKHTKRTLKGAIDKDGYVVFGLPNKKGKIKTRKAHRLVAQNFISTVDESLTVNHKDGIKTNNRVSNLEWCDVAYNNKHAREHGLNPMTGVDNSFNKFSEKLIKQICKMIANGYSNTEIINTLNINSDSKQAKHALVSSIRHGKSWTHISKKYLKW